MGDQEVGTKLTNAQLVKVEQGEDADKSARRSTSPFSCNPRKVRVSILCDMPSIDLSSALKRTRPWVMPPITRTVQMLDAMAQNYRYKRSLQIVV